MFYRVVLLVVLTLIGLWFGLDTAKEPRRFISVLGMLVYVGISYAFSVHRRKVSCKISFETSLGFNTARLIDQNFNM